MLFPRENSLQKKYQFRPKNKTSQGESSRIPNVQWEGLETHFLEIHSMSSNSSDIWTTYAEHIEGTDIGNLSPEVAHHIAFQWRTRCSCNRSYRKCQKQIYTRKQEMIGSMKTDRQWIAWNKYLRIWALACVNTDVCIWMIQIWSDKLLIPMYDLAKCDTWTNSSTLMVPNNLYAIHTARHLLMHHHHNARVAENIKSERY